MGALTLVLGPGPMGAQTAVTQNNLVQNGGFDDTSGTPWSHTTGGGIYFYSAGPPNPDNETDSIASFGSWTGYAIWQTTGATLQANLDYVVCLRARTGDGQLGGFNVALQDVTTASSTLTNQTFWFPNADQGQAPGPFHIYWFRFNSAKLPGQTGDSLGLSINCQTNPAWGQTYGWLHLDWVQLAPAVPKISVQPQNTTNYLGATAAFNVTAIGAVTNTANPGGLGYQWYKTPATPLTGATNATLTFTNLAAANAGNYFVVASGSFGSGQSSNALLTVLTNTVPCVVNPSNVLVSSFEGWGTSLCWWANVVGAYANRTTYASLAFTTLGLNIVRYNIGGGENPGIANTMEFRAQMPGFEPSPGVWNWSADANQRWMLRQAVALGANRVEAFANSPPWWMTVSGSVTGSTNGTSNNLQTGYEVAFASYLATVVSNLSVLDHVTFDTVTPVNEPTSSWWVYGGRQEGCHISASQQARLVNDLATDLAPLAPVVGIAASEDNDENSTLNSLNAYGTTSLANTTRFVTHTYGANNPSGLQALASAQHKPLWVSEYGDGDASGLTMARRIHDDLTQMSARAWIYWQVVDNAGGWGLLLNGLDSSGNNTYSINQKFYAMYQFSHFIRPGCVILGASDNWSLAAYDATNHNLVLVAVNDTSTGFNLNYDLSTFSNTGTTVSRYRTSASESAAAVPALTISNRQFVAYVAPQSVTTHVIAGVIATNHAPSLSAIANRSLLAGQWLLITNGATDPDLPAQTLKWSLPFGPTGAAVNPTNGVLSWRPTMSQSPQTNLFRVVVTDNGTPSLSATQSFTVMVSRPARPNLSSPRLANGVLTWMATGDPGPDYVFEATTNLAPSPLWVPFWTNLLAQPPFPWTDPSFGGPGTRFYRVTLQP